MRRKVENVQVNKPLDSVHDNYTILGDGVEITIIGELRC